MDKYIFSDEFINKIESIQEKKPTDEEIKILTKYYESDNEFLTPD
jgi:hypothetical protein